MNVDQVRLLIIQANPPGSVALGTAEEVRKLQSALHRGQERDHFAHPAHLPAARVSDLLTELRAHQPQILHFTGHGDGAGGLLLNAPDDKRAAILTATDLAALLQVYQAEAATPLQLVVLAGCQTAGVADLLVKHVGCVVAVAGDIRDDAVRDALTPSFYAALSDGRSVANAVASAQSVMTALGFATDAALLHPYTRPGLDPATLHPRDWLTRPAPPATRHTSLHLDYLRHWFTQPWTRVALADIQPDQPDHAHLLDLYVPLPVACTLVIKTEEGRIIDWWVKGARGEGAGGGQPSGKLPASRMVDDDDDDRPDEALPKQRQWTDLRVGEAELGRLIAQRQQTLDQRRGEDRPIRDGEHEWPLAAHHAALVQPRFVLLGDPGSGKSSFLRHLTLCLAGALRHEAGAPGVPANATVAALADWDLAAYTPIYVELRNLVRIAFPPLPPAAQERAKPPTAETFWLYVRDPLLPSALTGFARDLRTLADEGKAILLLDGLDEVPQADDPRRREQVKALIAALVNDTPKLRIIVGSRPYAYQVGEWALVGFGHTTLQPLHREQLQTLAQALLAATVTPPPNLPQLGGGTDVAPTASRLPPQTGEGWGGVAETFVAALTDHPHLDERLYANPLFFTLLAALWLTDTAQRLPTTQAELYRRAVDLLLERWARRRAPDLSVVETLGLTVAELRPVLESFACTVQETAQPGQDTTTFRLGDLLNVLAEAGYNPRIQDVATYLERHAGLLVSPRRSYFYFSHRSFQEHLAACELTCRTRTERRPPVTIDRRFPTGLIRRVQAEPTRWRTVAYLAAGELMTQGREGETLLWELLDEFCQPYLTAQHAPAAAVIALGIARHHDLFDLRPSDRRYRRHLEPLRQVALQVLTDVANFTPAERNIAGELLGRHPEHDTRKGVGCRPDGLPDLDWVEIPEADTQGRCEFIYQEDERRIEPTFWLARYPITYSQFQVFLDAADGFYNRSLGFRQRWPGHSAT